MLQIVILDEVPKEVHHILIGGSLPFYVTPFNSETISIYSNGHFAYDVFDLVGKNNLVSSSPIFRGVLNSDNGIQIGLYILDKDNEFLGQKSVKNVIFKPNYVTRLSGKLFDSLNPIEKMGSLKIDFVREYSEVVINQPF